MTSYVEKKSEIQQNDRMGIISTLVKKKWDT